MACLGVSCLHWARTMFPDCFYPTRVFLSLVLRSRQAAHKTNLLDNQFDFILTDLSLDHARLIIGVFDV